jgi:hypothetical protein
VVQLWLRAGQRDFVIEEIGEVSKDEENYGEFQAATVSAWSYLDKQDQGDEEDNRSIFPLVPNLSPISTDEYKLGKRR